MPNARLSQLQAQVPDHQAWIIATPNHVAYLTNFEFLVPEEREALLLISRDKALLIQASFSPHPENWADQTEFATSPEKIATKISDFISTNQISSLQLDMIGLNAEEFQQIAKLQIKTEPLDLATVWQLRMQKSPEEQAKITRAIEIGQNVLDRCRQQLQLGQTEQQIKTWIEVELLKTGSQRPAFPPIVAFGDHTALPHHQPTDRPLTDNTAVLIDMGATFQNYRSDMTRSWWFGNQPDSEYLKIESVVNLAFQAGMTKISSLPYPTAAELDQVVREVIKTAGYGPQFIHTTGHGLGLDIHEPPSLNPKNTSPLVSGMAITIEPGIYLPDKFGIRLEDTVILR